MKSTSQTIQSKNDRRMEVWESEAGRDILNRRRRPMEPWIAEEVVKANNFALMWASQGGIEAALRFANDRLKDTKRDIAWRMDDDVIIQLHEFVQTESLNDIAGLAWAQLMLDEEHGREDHLHTERDFVRAIFNLTYTDDNDNIVWDIDGAKEAKALKKETISELEKIRARMDALLARRAEEAAEASAKADMLYAQEEEERTRQYEDALDYAV